VLVVLVAVGLLVCWFTKIGLPRRKCKIMSEAVKNILVTISMNSNKIQEPFFYHITKNTLVTLADLPKEVVFKVDGQELPGAFIDASRYQLQELPHELCRMATGLGNAMFCAHMQSKGVKLDEEVIVWKCELN
jgi:hypothetical protein